MLPVLVPLHKCPAPYSPLDVLQLMTNNTAKVAQAIQSSNIAKLTAAVKSTDPTRSFVQDSISDSVSTGLDMVSSS